MRQRLCSLSQGLCLFGFRRPEPRRLVWAAEGSPVSELRGDPALQPVSSGISRGEYGTDEDSKNSTRERLIGNDLHFDLAAEHEVHRKNRAHGWVVNEIGFVDLVEGDEISRISQPAFATHNVIECAFCDRECRLYEIKGTMNLLLEGHGLITGSVIDDTAGVVKIDLGRIKGPRSIG